jgi:SPP1 gp7 family putative phage head morphogenesis protein
VETPPASPDAFQEAVAAWRKRVPVTEDELAQLTEELRDLAFNVAGITQADMVTQVYQALDSAIANGDSFDTFKANIADRLGESWSEDAQAPSLETVFRTNVQTAYNDGRDSIISNDAIKESHPYLRYDAILDDRTSDICAELNDTTLPQDDEFWDSHRPPMHFNCRCILTPITQDDGDRDGVDKQGPAIEADDGFGGRASSWQPDPKDYPDEIQGILDRRLSDG